MNAPEQGMRGRRREDRKAGEGDRDERRALGNCGHGGKPTPNRGLFHHFFGADVDFLGVHGLDDRDVAGLAPRHPLVRQVDAAAVK